MLTQPTVQSVFTEFYFLFSKAYFSSVILKYVFKYLQFCHSTCFRHNFSVLTPIWPVQIALGS
jgi:hypothetical protein